VFKEGEIMIPKTLDHIEEKDLQALIEDSVIEGKAIEYKQALPSNSDSDKKEFLADVSSFANSSGGDLLFGVVEENGIAKELLGLDIANVDHEIRRMENTIRDGIEPRIPTLYTKAVQLSNSRAVLLLRIPKSWIGPHRVSFKGHDKFYSRSSNGKYPLDVSELRIAFSLSEAITDRIRKFREDRISKIFANETPVPFYENAKIALHLMPLISFSSAQTYDLSKIAAMPAQLPPIYCSSWSHRYNLDGFLTYSGGDEGKSHSYAQLFRNGIVEAVEGLLLKPYKGLLIPSLAYEEELCESLGKCLFVLKTLSIEPPILGFLSFLGVKGYEMEVVSHHRALRYAARDGNKVDRDVLMLPEFVIESYDVTPSTILKPCFDSVWNACGFPRSLNYNEAGEWVG
jgi:hypothetical protein